MMLDLKLLEYSSHLKITEKEGSTVVYDVIRNKNIVLLPEEMVRQCIIYFLIEKMKISKNLIRVEKGLKVNGLFRRSDLIIYDRNAIPLMIIEIKSPRVKVTQSVFNQVAMYNIPLRVPYLMVSNGLDSYVCRLNLEKSTYNFEENFPSYETLIGKH